MSNTNLPKRPAEEDTKTEADSRSISGKSDKTEKSTHDEKSHAKAGKVTGAGGGKKQERHH